MTIRGSIGVLAAAWLALSAPPAIAGKVKKPQCRAIEVTSVEGAAGKGNAFSAARTSDLVFRVLLDPGLAGEHTLELRLLTPRGFLYRSLVAPVSFGMTVGKLEAKRSVEGYPAPLPVRRATRVTLAGENAQAVELSFPVGGTDIVGSSLYGRWTVQPYLDGAETPCGNELKVRITE